MLNARVIKVTSKNAQSGKVSLQCSDVTDFVEGKMQALLIFNEGEPIENGVIYSGENLNRLIASAIHNGSLYNRDSGEIFYLASR